MYACMYVCVCMYGCIYLCGYVCVYVCMYACMYVGMYVCVCMHVCMCVYVCMAVYMYVGICVCMYVCMWVYMYVSLHACIYMCACKIVLHFKSTNTLHIIVQLVSISIPASLRNCRCALLMDSASARLSANCSQLNLNDTSPGNMNRTHTVARKLTKEKKRQNLREIATTLVMTMPVSNMQFTISLTLSGNA
jgi:hypothetical protein